MNDASAGQDGWFRQHPKLTYWGSRGLFAAGTVVFVDQSSRGLPRWQLYLALALFIACSATFVVRQLTLGHTAGGGTPGWLIFAALVFGIAGLSVLGFYLKTDHKWDALLLIGLVLLLLGLGWFVEWWRGKSVAALPWWGAGFLVLTGAAAIVVARELPGAKDGWFVALVVILGVAVFVTLPLGLNLLSEWGLHRARASQFGRDIGRGGLVVVALVVLAILGLVYWDWVLLATLMGVVLLLLLAIVSNTHLDVALVLAGLCLLASAPPEDPVPDELKPQGGTKVLVAMGDSFMSGEGAERFLEGTDNADGNECRQAPSAFAVKMVTRKDPRFDRLLFTACSGARTFQVLASDDPKASPQPPLPRTQIDELIQQLPSFRPAMVIVSLGGNDAGFASIGQACLAPSSCDDDVVKPLFTENLPSVQRALTETYKSLKKHLPPNVPIVAVPYPQLIADAKRCSGVALTKPERKFIHDFVRDLNQTVHAAAAAAHIDYYLMEMEGAFADNGLQLCQARKGAAGVNFVDIKSVNGLAAQRFSPGKWIHNSLHPNEDGHKVMLKTLDTWLDGHPEVLQPASVGRDAVTDPLPPCEMKDKSDKGCTKRVQKWALQQVVNRWPLLFLVVPGLAILWLASIAAISLLPQRPGQKSG
ncbi:GDSL-type esterase/lipase family protein [Streptomyces flavidovirens]|uniref:GDSL-type esterase/lipase family protein n=1 Tax=Streptomyces flavidovirens TaxID=67298 RepID=UPI0033B5E18D